jgi:hypothetical protein
MTRSCFRNASSIRAWARSRARTPQGN